MAPSVMSFTVALAGTENLYSTISNTGTIGLSGLSYQVTLSGNTIVVVPLATFTLFTCSVVWTGTTCSGTSTTIGTYTANTTTTVSTALVLPAVGGNVYLEAHMAATAAVGPTMTVIMLVTGPSQTRAAITTNQ